MPIPAVTARYDWILALISIAFVFSAFGNGANDVANSYATSVAARTLSMPQAGLLSVCTEFIGAVALGSRVTSTIKNGIINIKRFDGQPGALMLAMSCAEVGSAAWLIIATRVGFPVSTTQTIVGAIIGVGFASQAKIKWAWASGSVSQIASSWVIAPGIAACFAAIIFGTVKYGVLERKDPLKWALRLIPFYLATTAAILALFIVIEAPTAPSLEEFGAGKVCGIVLGVWAGMLIISYTFFLPYFTRRLIKNDARLRWYHIPLGPTLWRENPYIYLPADPNGDVVIDYYEGAWDEDDSSTASSPPLNAMEKDGEKTFPVADTSAIENGHKHVNPDGTVRRRKKVIEPEERFLAPTAHLSPFHPQRLWSYTKYFLLQGVTRDCVTHGSDRIQRNHARAIKYDNKAEHLWTYAQVASAMLMSIAHGSNDVSNAVGPWVATYRTYQAGEVDTSSKTPVFILVIAGLLLGTGFWFFGYHIIRSIGNRITQLSPTRGFAMEMGSAITVLLASRLALPVSTTQCLIGACMGVALMNYDLGAVNWRQMLFILMGWILTLPCAGLISGILCLIALNTPHFTG